MPCAEFHRGSSSPLGYTAQTEREKNQEAQQSVDIRCGQLINRHQLGDVRAVRYPHNQIAYIKMLHKPSTLLLSRDVDVLRSVAGILSVISLFGAEKWVCGMRCWIALSFGNLLVRSVEGLKLTLDTLSHHDLGLDGLGQSLYQSHPARLPLVSRSYTRHSPPQSMQLKLQRLLELVRG